MQLTFIQYQFLTQAWDFWKEGTWVELMDPTLCDSCITQQQLRCIQVSLLFMRRIERAFDRLTMSEIISMLTSENMPFPMPKKPAFSFGRKVNEVYTVHM